MQEYGDEQGRTETVGGVYWPLLSVWTSDCRMIFIIRNGDSSVYHWCIPRLTAISGTSLSRPHSVISAGLPLEIVNVGERGLKKRRPTYSYQETAKHVVVLRHEVKDSRDQDSALKSVAT